MTTKPDLDRFNQIFSEHIEQQSHSERIANLVYFFQFRQLHLETMAKGGYDGLIGVFENLQSSEHLSVFANYGATLLGWLQAETDPIKQIEFKIALDIFKDYFFGLAEAVRSK